MAKRYFTYHIRVANRDRVQVEKWDDQHQDQGQPSGAFRYQEKLVEIAPLLQAASNNELNDSTLVESLGEALFDVLFDDKLCQDFVSFYDQVVHQKKQLLRVELNIDEQGMSEIAALPWEFMCVPRRARSGIIWMGTVPNVVLCRRRSQWSAAQSIQLAPDEKIRIALVISAPPNLPPVAYEPVQAALEKLAREQAKRVELLPIVSPATPEAIDTILSKNPHIFYFIGHGRMKNEGNQEVGEMAFVDPDLDEAMWVDANYFSELFNQHRPGVVILQACESGMLSPSQAFVGVASKVGQQNVPVVVAMQYEVTNSTATKFALDFCKHLAAGYPVDIAAQCGRRAIAFGSTKYHKRDFATPVIFMRVKDGYLFKRQSASSQFNQQPDFSVNPQIIQGRDIDKRNIYENGQFIHWLIRNSKLSNFSQESSQDFDFSGIPSESIQKAYQDSLPPDADVWDLPPPNADMPDLAGDNIEAILKKLEEFSKIPQFGERLSQDQTLPIESRERIANLFESKKNPEDHNNKLTTGLSYNQLGPLKSYLIATLAPVAPDDEKFLLNAWLIMDDSVQNLSKFQSLLDQNEQQAGKLCKLTQIPTELNKFLEKALRYLINRKYNLTIEIFLPCHLMCMEIDRWKITDPIVDDITLGIRYPVRLRSLERLSRRYLYSYLSQWYQSWDKVREILQNEPTQEIFEHLQEMESFNCKLLTSKLKEKIGLKVTCSHSKSITKDLFKAILAATTPIAIWTRADIANLDQVTAINDILTFKPLCNLSESVRRNREEADNAQTEEHLGHHLALLWENPYRLTPDAMLELSSPGQ
jgi:hypothetical protein